MRSKATDPAMRRWRAATLLAVGAVIGMVMIATPAGAHVGGTVSHLWKQHIRPKADARYVKLRSPQAPLRSGVTIRGVIGGDFHASASSDWRVEQSFSIRSPIVLPLGAVDVDGQDEASNRCTGTANTPTAPPGVVCIYLDSSFNAAGFLGYGAPNPAAGSVYGFMLNWTSGSGDTWAHATWAYTAP
jgi:hypothetical protein